ncbi:MAG TPA: alpha/beta fold hydrolase [Gemmatimonadales bacterium]|nr:alpha/beta fold hydrolase [Gemmatimonadales bacterium]
MTRRLALLLALTTGCRAAPLPQAERFPSGTRFAARHVRVDDTSIRYLDAGAGTPVIFIHGLGASLYTWRENLDAVATAGFRVVAYDNRGFGSSDKPAHGYTNAEYARLLIALMDSLRITDAVLVGHSMGGAIAAETAIRYPERVRGLALIGSAGLGIREPTLLRLARWPVVGPVLLGFRGRGLVERLLKSTYADPSKVTDSDVDQYYAPVADPAYGRALRGVLRQFRLDGLTGRLDRIEAPALVLWGEADRWVPLALGRALAAQLARAAFLAVPRAGHAVHEEAPAEVNRLLIKFLKEGLPRIPEDLAWSAGWRASADDIDFINHLVEERAFAT